MFEQGKGKKTIETRDNEPQYGTQGLGADKTQPAKPEPKAAEQKAVETRDEDAWPEKSWQTVTATDTPTTTPAPEKKAEPKAKSAEPDPLGVQSVLDALDECGLGSIKDVNEQKWGPADVSSLKRIQKALDILTAARDKLLVKRTA